MEFKLIFTEIDKRQIQDFIDFHKNSSFVSDRIQKNIEGERSDITKDRFWQSLMMGLLTTQQRSGPDSQISKFLDLKPFPISFERCNSDKDVHDLIYQALNNFNGIRRAKTIADQAQKNLLWLKESEGWQKIFNHIEKIQKLSSIETEREAANVLSRYLAGIGPKQSRNVLQELGITRFVLPIDSRLVKRLKEFNFPVPLSAAALSDESYYKFVEDCVIYICRKLDIYPAIFDAILFSSFDGDGWETRKANAPT
ncbi:MAG: hypothetical protein H8D23_13210 [Candidatus Brocadiales bacterium]|nr:hypothetical protein [Candidatus Brocadiales bacterium]